MATASKTLYRLNAQKLQLLGLTDDNGAFVNSAVVTATMNDQSGTPVAEINGASLASTGSGGNYSYTIPSTFNQPCGSYVCVITATLSGVLILTIDQPITVTDRTS